MREFLRNIQDLGLISYAKPRRGTGQAASLVFVNEDIVMADVCETDEGIAMSFHVEISGCDDEVISKVQEIVAILEAKNKNE